MRFSNFSAFDSQNRQVLLNVKDHYMDVTINDFDIGRPACFRLSENGAILLFQALKVIYEQKRT